MSPPILTCSPLTPDAYAPYGHVIMASPRGEPGKPANQGTARRFDHLASLDDLRPGRAKLNVTVFRCAPRPTGPFAVELLEKHPASTQIFVPMNAERYLVLVARGGDRPDLATLGAFIATGTQGVSYHPGVWHHPMIALDREIEFACFVFEDGSADDCTVVPIPPEERPVVMIAPR
ncbi:MAG: ureidoglycolate lyase [Minicystis sp.]